MAQAKEVRGPGPRGMGPKPKVENPGLLLKRIMGEVFRHYLPHCILVLVCIVVSALANVQASLFLQTLMDDYIVPMTQQQNPDFAPLAAALLRVGVIYVIGILAAWLNARTMVNVTQGTLRNLRIQLFTHMESLPIKYFDQHPHGDIMSVYTNDVDTLRQMLSQSIPQLISSAITIVSVFVSMCILDIRLTVVTMLMVALMLFTTKKITSQSGKYFIAQQRDLGKLNGYVEEMYSGHEVVRISRAAEPVGKTFDTLNDAVYDANWRSQFLSGVMQPLMNVIGNLSYVAVCVLGSILAIQGIIDIGVIVSFILYVRLFTSPLTQIAQGMTNLQTASASAHRIFDFLGSEEMPDESEKPELPRPVRGEVDFEHVRFSYPDSPDKIIIKDFSAHVAPGQKVAIVGPTGAGKTTMVNLLMRFYEIADGCIKIDGVPSQDIRREDVHKLFGMVLQDTWLFEGTVRENLVYNLPDVTDEQLNRVCCACGLDKFVRSLPNGFDTVLSESTSISAGQKQLLTIARAMLQNAPMLILDEATSSVDTRTELLIQRAMDKLTENRTSFVIAHRLSTIKNADLILVMKDGDIVEQGRHEELLKKQGFYANLYNSQFEETVA